jgi:Uma2 family endonuclease
LEPTRARSAAVPASERPTFRHRHPRAEETLLVVEIAPSSALVDRRKTAIYAAARAREYWLLDATRPRLVVHRRPSGAAYVEVETMIAVAAPGGGPEVTVSDVPG